MVYKPKKEVRYRPGHGFQGIEAATIEERVEAIRRRRGDGLCPAGDLVADAEPEDASLHGGFTWDDSECGPKWREEEARRMIRSYEVISIDKGGEEHSQIANVSVASGPATPGGAYMATHAAMEDPDIRARIVARERATLLSWEKRCAHFVELAGYAAAIRKAHAKEKRAQPQPTA